MNRSHIMLFFGGIGSVIGKRATPGARCVFAVIVIVVVERIGPAQLLRPALTTTENAKTRRSRRREEHSSQNPIRPCRVIGLAGCGRGSTARHGRQNRDREHCVEQPLRPRRGSTGPWMNDAMASSRQPMTGQRPMRTTLDIDPDVLNAVKQRTRRNAARRVPCSPISRAVR